MKRTVVLLVVLSVLPVGYLVVGPYLTLNAIRTALETEDLERLTEYVDFPELRRNVQSQVQALLAKRNLGPDGVAGSTVVVGDVIVEALVERFVTPATILSWAAGESTVPIVAAETSANADGSVVIPDTPPPAKTFFEDVRTSYESISRFAIWVSNDRDEEVGFILTRRGFAWKLTNIVLPEHELQQRALTGWSCW
jgi:hypothetical protein